MTCQVCSSKVEAKLNTKSGNDLAICFAHFIDAMRLTTMAATGMDYRDAALIRQAVKEGWTPQIISNIYDIKPQTVFAILEKRLYKIIPRTLRPSYDWVEDERSREARRYRP